MAKVSYRLKVIRKNFWRRVRPHAKTIGLISSGVILGASAYALASIPDSSGVIHACYSTKNGNSFGSVRIIDSATTPTCGNQETAITWNQTGPAGAPGAPGAQGPAGPQGPQGPAGSSGAGSFLPNFGSSNLGKADLRFRDFKNVDFSNSFFQSDKFDQSDFSGANFTNANLRSSTFFGANLNGANFTNATLTGAILDQNTVSGAVFGRTIFGGASVNNLSASGLYFQGAINLNFSRGYVHYQIGERAPLKYTTQFSISPTYANYYWSKLAFDGPVVQTGEVGYMLPSALTAGSGGKNIGYPNPVTVTLPNVNLTSVVAAKLSFVNSYTYIDPLSSSNAVLHYSLNGGPSRTPNPQPNAVAEEFCSGCPGPSGGGEVLYTFPVAVSDLRSGSNTISLSVDNMNGGWPAIMTNLDLLTFTTNVP